MRKLSLLLTIFLIAACAAGGPVPPVAAQTTFEQVDTTATQTIQNKTFDSTNTYNGGTFTNPTLASPTITGTVAGKATYTEPAWTSYPTASLPGTCTNYAQAAVSDGLRGPAECQGNYWKRRFYMDAQDFSVTRDDNTSDTTNLNTALSNQIAVDLANQQSGGQLMLPMGVYHINDSIVSPSSGPAYMDLSGSGWSSVIATKTGMAGKPMVSLTNVLDSVIGNVRFMPASSETVSACIRATSDAAGSYRGWGGQAGLLFLWHVKCQAKTGNFTNGIVFENTWPPNGNNEINTLLDVNVTSATNCAYLVNSGTAVFNRIFGGHLHGTAGLCFNYGADMVFGPTINASGAGRFDLEFDNTTGTASDYSNNIFGGLDEGGKGLLKTTAAYTGPVYLFGGFYNTFSGTPGENNIFHQGTKMVSLFGVNHLVGNTSVYKATNTGNEAGLRLIGNHLNISSVDYAKHFLSIGNTWTIGGTTRVRGANSINMQWMDYGFDSATTATSWMEKWPVHFGPAAPTGVSGPDGQLFAAYLCPYRSGLSGFAPTLSNSYDYVCLYVAGDGTVYLANRSGTNLMLWSGADGTTYVQNHLFWTTDNTYLIGSAGTNRPKELHLGGPAVTAGSGTGVTVDDKGQVRQQVYKVTVSYTNCVAAATTCDLTIATLPAKTFLMRAFADLTTQYACAATCTSSTLSATLGTSAGGTQLLASWDLDAATGQFGDADAELGSSMNAAARAANGALFDGVLMSWTGTTTLTYRITSGTGNLGNGSATNLSQGSVTFYLVTEILP